MSTDRQTLIEQYAAGYSEVVKNLEGFPKEKLSDHLIPGKWSASEIVHHLGDSETISAIRLRRLLAEDRPVIQGYDQDLYAIKLRYNERDITPALEAFRAARATSVELLKLMADEDWKRQGWHTEHGTYTPEDWLRIYAVHAHNHAEQIKRLKETI
jgi:hypothetical protein